VVKYINSSGTVLRNYEYDAFGEEANASATDANPFRYAGQYFDSETGTYYLRARYYNPALGRFTQADKHWNTGNMLYGDDPLMLTQYIAKPDMLAILQSGNLYSYCIGNPVAYVDETGHSIILTGIIVGAAIGAVVGGTATGIWAHNNSNENVSDNWGWYALAGAVGGGIVGGLTGWGAGKMVLSVSWTSKATQIVGASSVVLGNTFEKWFYKMYDIVKTNQQIVVKGIGRIDAFSKGMIYELKNYTWSIYPNSRLIKLASQFVEQAQRYMKIENIAGEKVKGLTFFFSSKPPQIIMSALEEIGVHIKWVS